jgi:hypothetical protein
VLVETDALPTEADAGAVEGGIRRPEPQRLLRAQEMCQLYFRIGDRIAFLEAYCPLSPAGRRGGEWFEPPGDVRPRKGGKIK